MRDWAGTSCLQINNLHCPRLHFHIQVVEDNFRILTPAIVFVTVIHFDGRHDDLVMSVAAHDSNRLKRRRVFSTSRSKKNRILLDMWTLTFDEPVQLDPLSLNLWLSIELYIDSKVSHLSKN